ncbi:hypothetical protein ABPG74_007752 [Tetrahymena malaccensis]
MRVKQEESLEDQAFMVQQTRIQVTSSEKIQQQLYIPVDQVKKQIIFRDDIDLFLKVLRMAVIQKNIQEQNYKYFEQISTMLINVLTQYLNQESNSCDKENNGQMQMIYKQVQQLILSLLEEANEEVLIHMRNLCYGTFSYLMQILQHQVRIPYQRIVEFEKVLEFLFTQELGREYKQISKVIQEIQQKNETFYRAQNIYYFYKQLQAINIQLKVQAFRQKIIHFEKQGNSKINQQMCHQSQIKNISQDDKQKARRIFKIPFILSQRLRNQKQSKTQNEKIGQSKEVKHNYNNISNRCQYSYQQITIKGQQMNIHLSQSQQQHLKNIKTKNNISQFKNKIISLACKQQNINKAKLSPQNSGKINYKKVQRNCYNYFQLNTKSDQQIQSYTEQTQITQSKNIQNKDLETFNGQKYSFLVNKQNEKILGGGICGSNARVVSINKISKEQQIQQIMNEKQHLMEKFQVYSENDELDDTNLLQVKEFSDSIVDKLKNIASLIAQSHQFRYIKAQLLLFFAQILQTSNQNKGQFDEIMISVVSNYLQEKQKSVKIIYEGNQIMADFIHNHLDKNIHYMNKKNIFVITANKSIFEIDPKTLERINCFTFQQAIASFSAHNNKYMITLANNQIHFGNFENGFKILDKTKIQADKSLFINDYIIASSNNQIKVYNLSNMSLLKTIDDSFNDLNISAFSADGKYLALIYQYDSCQIFSIDKGFETVNLIEGHDLRASSITFSADGKYLAIGSDNCFIKIFNVEKGFELIQTIEGHVETINSVSFSTDGKYLATSSLDNNCKIWNVENEFGLSHTIQGHINWINSVAFSANGNHFATSSSDKTCKLWKMGKKIELIHTFNDYEQNITTTTFSTNGKYLAIGSSDSTCKVWIIEKELKLISTTSGDNFEITSLAFSADDKYLAMSLEDGTLKVLSVDNAFKLVNTTKGHNQTITSASFSADNKYLATGSMDFTCKIWSVENEFKLVYTIQKHTEMITQVSFSADCKYLITSSKDITCKIFSVEKGFDLINSISGHTQTITSVAFSKNGKYLATGSDDNTCNIWSVEKGFELINKIQEHTWSIISISFSADSKYLLTGSKDNTCKIWNIEKGFEFISPIQGHAQAITSVAHSKDGKYLVTGSEDKTYQVWNMQKGCELISQIQGHTSLITSVAFSADSKYLATGSEDNSCRVWNVEKGFELISTIESHTWYVSSVAFSPDNQYLITGSDDSTFKIWNVQKGFKQYKSIEANIHNITSVTFSADGKYLATGSESNKCKIWNVSKGFKLMHTIEGHTFQIKSVTFSADGKYLATGSYDKTCKVWDAQKNFQLVNTIEGHSQIITSVAFSADSKYLATCSYDQTCKIWSVEKQFQLINIIKTHTDQIKSVTFSADGKYLTTGSQDNTCKIINVERGFEILNKIQGETQEITSVAFSENGKYLATGSEDKIFKIWDIQNGYNLIDEQIQSNFNWINLNTFEITIREQNNNLTLIFKNQRIFEQVYEV